jgi:hypothetical protein
MNNIDNIMTQEEIDECSKIVHQLKGTNTLVAILEHYGKLFVPKKNLMELIEVEQVWPNDFIYNHGSAMCITYEPDTQMFGFELRYKMDGNEPWNSFGYTCTRNQTDVGFVDHDSPLYKE